MFSLRSLIEAQKASYVSYIRSDGTNDGHINNAFWEVRSNPIFMCGVYFTADFEKPKFKTKSLLTQGIRQRILFVHATTKDVTQLTGVHCPEKQRWRNEKLYLSIVARGVGKTAAYNCKNCRRTDHPLHTPSSNKANAL